MIIEKILEQKASRIKQWPVRSNRASEIGHQCLRFLVLNRTRWQEKTLHDVRLQTIFDEGNLHEEAVITELRKSGFKVIEQQRPFEWREYEITGYIDLKLVLEANYETGFLAEQKGIVPVEIKSISPFSFDKINSSEDLIKAKQPWLQRYPGQLTIYLLMDNKDWGLFIFKNKATGELKEIWLQLDYELGEQLLQKAETVIQHMKNNTLPDCIPYNDQICKDCGYFHICLPEIKRDALEFTLDPEMENKIDRWFELKQATSEYRSLDKIIKETFYEKEKVVVGNYLITGKHTSDKKWKSNIQKLEG